MQILSANNLNQSVNTNLSLKSFRNNTKKHQVKPLKITEIRLLIDLIETTMGLTSVKEILLIKGCLTVKNGSKNNQQTLIRIYISKLCLSRIIIKRTAMNDKDFNDDSNSVSIGFAPLQMRTVKTKTTKHQGSDLVFQRIKLLQHRLVTSISIITPIPMHNYTFRNQLKNYRFQKKSKTSPFSNQIPTVDPRESQQIFATFKDLFANWRTNLKHKYFIAFSNGDLAYFFHKSEQVSLKKGVKKEESYVVLSCRKSSFSTIFDDYKIPYESLPGIHLQNQRLLIKKSGIHLYWKYLTSLSIEKPANFQIIANFYFMNSLQVLPLEKYNGKQQRPDYEHLAEKKLNILGEEQSQLYCLRMEGFWMKENVEKMSEKLQGMIEQMKFDIQCECHFGSDDFQNLCEKL